MGDSAIASQTGSTLSLTLRYEMTCAQPGPGPLVVTLPQSFRLADLHVTVRGAQRPALSTGSTLTISLPRPPQVTCMSIGIGTLPVTMRGPR